jgi:hypothetical protein
MKKSRGPEEFWADYEARYGEKVLGRALGRYLSGWQDFTEISRAGLWGLIVATSGGFRFLHLPGEGWMTALTRIISGGEAPKERELFIPNDSIVTACLRREKSWWKRLLFSRPPVLVIFYRDVSGIQQELCFETIQKGDEVAEKLKKGEALP